MPLKIKFIANSPMSNYGGAQINPSYLFLKTYHDLYGKAQIEWLPWDAVALDGEEENTRQIISEAPDILCLAMFVWNEDRHYRTAQAVKAALPNTVIFMGGPQLDAHKNPDFFKQHPYVDWVCYGDGERAFTQLVEYIAGTNLAPDFVNLVRNVDGETLVYPHEVFNDPLYWKTSPYLTNKEIVLETYDRIEKAGIDLWKMRMGVEFARGCMYNCHFCDWSQNLTKKVKRRSHDWKADIDWFFENGIRINETDANFGQWKEDIEIFDYCMKLHVDNPGTRFRLEIVNTSKLKKDATYHIMYEQCMKYDWFPPIVSMQDPDDEVLENIERPDLGYEINRALVQKFRENLPEHKKSMVAFTHIILCLPGSTREKMVNNYKRMIRDGWNPALIELMYFIRLVNAPAANPEYEKKWGLVCKDVYGILEYTGREEALWDDSRELRDIYEDIKNHRYDDKKLFPIKAYIQNNTMPMLDMFQTRFILHTVRDYHREHKTRVCPDMMDNWEEVMDGLIAKAADDATEYVRQNAPLLEEYGFLVLGYKVDGKFKTLIV